MERQANDSQHHLKRCFKCSAELPLSEFYKHPMMADGHLGKCKACAKQDVKTNYSKRREQYSRYEKARNQRPQRKAALASSVLRRRVRNPEKYRARTAVGNALRDGRLQREPCEVCGAHAEAHHDDYSKPLAVRWLCFAHHREHHRIEGD